MENNNKFNKQKETIENLLEINDPIINTFFKDIIKKIAFGLQYQHLQNNNLKCEAKNCNNNWRGCKTIFGTKMILIELLCINHLKEIKKDEENLKFEELII